MSSVPVSRRKPHGFITPHKLKELRNSVTELAINDFGYDKDRLERKIEKFEATVTNFERKDEIVASMRKKNESFFSNFTEKETDIVLDIVRKIIFEFEVGNSIHPTGEARVKEFRERRLHLDMAIGWLCCLKQELQYIAETLPGDKNRYCTTSDNIKELIGMVKGVRRDTNKYLKSRDNYKKGNL